MVCRLPPGDYNMTSGCHGDSKTANFSLPVCSPTREAGKNVQTVFFWCSAACHRLFPEICGLPLSSLLGAKDKISYSCEWEFSKIVAFKSTIRKFLNVVAAHIRGLKFPFICLFDTLFSCQCPFKI
jgi:hypothetical protein